MFLLQPSALLQSHSCLCLEGCKHRNSQWGGFLPGLTAKGAQHILPFPWALLPSKAVAGAGTQDSLPFLLAPEKPCHSVILIFCTVGCWREWGEFCGLCTGCYKESSRLCVSYAVVCSWHQHLMFQTLSSGFSYHLYSLHGPAASCLLLLGAQTTTAPPSCFHTVSVWAFHFFNAQYLTLKIKKVKEQSQCKFNKSKILTSYKSWHKGFAHKKAALRHFTVTTVCTLPLFIH